MGSYTLADARTHVFRTLRDLGDTADVQLLTDTELDGYIGAATARYSLDCPRMVAVDADPDGTHFLALPTSWVEGLSHLEAVEYPIGETPPVYLDPREVRFYQSPTALKLYFETAPAIGTDTLRLIFTAGRVFAAQAANTTVVDVHFYPVCDLAVSRSCDAIAQKYAQAGEPIIGADFVEHRTKADIWASRAKRFEALYRSVIAPSAGGRWVNWGGRTGHGYDWMTHPERDR